MPRLPVYFVWPSDNARWAASITNGGVSKSGRPISKRMTFSPRASSAVTSSKIARMPDDGSDCTTELIGRLTTQCQWLPCPPALLRQYDRPSPTAEHHSGSTLVP